MSDENTHLTEEELIRVERGEVLEKDYFYIPIMHYSEPGIDDTIWYSLQFDDINPPKSLMSYASKVPAGQTLWQAVRHDLETDFRYPHDRSFVIESARPYDTASNKAGEELTRVLVDLSVSEMFSTRGVHPLGMQLIWQYEGEDVFNPIYDYFDENTP